jgi:subtilisin family serine protease
MYRLVLSAAVSAALAIPAATAVAAPPPEPDRVVQVTRAAKAVPGSYVVQLRAGAAAPSRATHVYTAAINGFAAQLSPAQLRDLQRHPDVVAISENAVIDALDATQPNPPSYGIDRIDQRNLPLSRSFTYNNTGAGVTAYVIDTGIDTGHGDFSGRARWGTNTIDSNNTDCNSHGTHVAGTVGGETYGVAKDVSLVAVKWLNCGGSGTTASVLGAVDWVTRNAVKPAVANASWNWSYDATVATAIRNMISSGVFLAASAGNTGGNSCDRLPRAIDTALVVASSDSADRRSSFSSTGPCVDIYAPGSSIRSTIPGGGNGLKSGTSMSTPHVAGTAALYLEDNRTSSPATVKSYLESNATSNVISGGGTGGTVNRLLFTNAL